MNHSFEVGDRVRALRDVSGIIEKGRCYTISVVHERGALEFEEFGDDDFCNWSPGNYEFVESRNEEFLKVLKENKRMIEI